MTSSVYSAGTVSVSGGSAIVTGTGTAWNVALVTGGMFSFAGMSLPIASVESDTSLTLAYAWPGADATGGYAIARETSEAVRAAWINDRLAQILTKLSLAGIHPDGAGTLAERDALSPAPAAGYLWLRVETGFDLAFYKRTASGWDGPFAMRGDEGEPGPPGSQGLTGADGDITWEGSWLTAINYTTNQAVEHGGSSYVATANHLSAAANEPGVGVDWATVWDVMAAKGGQGTPGNDGTPGVVQAVVAGSNISVDNSDPANPVVSSSAAGVTDGDKGDIVVSSGGTAWAVDSNAITYAKMQDVTATARVLGRKTAGAGDPEELTLSDVLDMIGSTAQGDMLFRGAAGWSRLPKGSAGQYLKQNTALTSPEWVTVPAREVLTANRTYYVRTDGADPNNGLTNTAGGAFLTIQKALDVIYTLDLGGYAVTVQVADGTYTGGISIATPFVGGAVTISGNVTTPANVILSHNAYGAFQVSGYGAAVSLRGLKIQNSAASSLGQGLLIINGGVVTLTGAMDLGTCTRYHFELTNNGTLNVTAGYTVSGDAALHWSVDGGKVVLSGQTITMSGTRAFNTFARCSGGGSVLSYNLTKVGSATGKYYSAELNGVINTIGGGASALFGNAAGTTATGGQYA